MTEYSLNDRLNFRLPEFTRISWVSNEAQITWQPRIQAIARAWENIEWLSVHAKIRTYALKRIKPENLIVESTHWANYGLSVLPLSIEREISSTYSSIPQKPEPGKPIIICIGIGKLKNAHLLKFAWNSMNHDKIGILLGYPTCCRKFFDQIWRESGYMDTTWPMASNTLKSDIQDELDVDGSIFTNILWRWMGVRATPHLPCSFDCKWSVELAERFVKVGRDVGYNQEMEWMSEILSWPVEWSALHGIAEIKTPILKVSTCTDSTAKKHIVRWKGLKYPSHGAVALKFPYKITKNRIGITNSASFLKGIEQSISLKSFQPEWHYQDNGFTSHHEMNKMQQPILSLVQRILKDNNGNILDMGCSNGILLKKIYEETHNIPYGIDINTNFIAHAKELLPQFSNNFICGDLININKLSTNRRYILGIVRIAALLNDSTKMIINFLKDNCDNILIYNYPRQNVDTFSALIHNAGFNIDEIEGSYAGILSNQR